jgi:hypothetical protein
MLMNCNRERWVFELRTEDGEPRTQNESTIISEKDLRKMQDRAAPWRGPGYLPKPQAQAAAGLRRRAAPEESEVERWRESQELIFP